MKASLILIVALLVFIFGVSAASAQPPATAPGVPSTPGQASVAAAPPATIGQMPAPYAAQGPTPPSFAAPPGTAAIPAPSPLGGLVPSAPRVAQGTPGVIAGPGGSCLCSGIAGETRSGTTPPVQPGISGGPCICPQSEAGGTITPPTGATIASSTASAPAAPTEPESTPEPP